MTFALYAVPAYLAGTFLLSALMVRVAPKAHSSRQIRKHLILFMVLPILLVVDMLLSIDAIRRFGLHLAHSAFEFLSGRRLHSSDEYGYAYFGYSRRRQNRRRSDRRARSMDTSNKVVSAKS